MANDQTPVTCVTGTCAMPVIVAGQTWVGEIPGQQEGPATFKVMSLTDRCHILVAVTDADGVVWDEDTISVVDMVAAIQLGWVSLDDRGVR